MMKVLRLALAALLTVSGLAFAQIDVNKADLVTLDGVKGIGPSMSKRILEERKKGEFKSWADFESRVKGVGGKKAAVLSTAGLRVNGAPRPADAGVGQKQPAAKEAKSSVASAEAATKK